MILKLLPNNSGFVIDAGTVQYEIAGNTCEKVNYSPEQLANLEEGFWDDGSLTGLLQNAILQEEKKVELGEMRTLLLLILEKAGA